MNISKEIITDEAERLMEACEPMTSLKISRCLASYYANEHRLNELLSLIILGNEELQQKQLLGIKK